MKDSIVNINVSQAQLDDIEISSSKKRGLIKNTILFKSIVIIFYFLIVIITEYFYRDYLFSKTIIFLEKLYEYSFSQTLIQFSKFMTILGDSTICGIINALIFLFYPINCSFLVLQAHCYSKYFSNLMKILYQSERPFWKSEKLINSCSSEYGNPSENSFTNIAFYLSIGHIIISQNLVNKKFFGIKVKSELLIKSIIFGYCGLFSLLLILSRVILGDHSINQIIFGGLLSIGLYYVLIHIMSYHKYKPNEFLNHFRKIVTVIFYSVFHFYILFTIFFVYLFEEENEIRKEELDKTIFNGKRCPIKSISSKDKAFSQTLSITAVIGAHLGIVCLFKFLKKNGYVINENIIIWNKTDFISFIKRLPVLFISALGIFLFFVIPENSSLYIIFLFKSALPFILGIFGLSFIGIYLCIKFGLANKNIAKVVVLKETPNKK